MKSTDSNADPTVNTEPIASEPLEVESDHTTAATQLNTDEMDGDTKKSQSFVHNRRVNYGTHAILLFNIKNYVKI